MNQCLKRSLSVLLFISLLVFPFLAFSESEPWDCPQCGRTDNTGNFCGGCGYPAVSPTPFPEPIDKTNDRLVNHITVLYYDRGAISGKLPIAMIYAHENGIYYDGFFSISDSPESFLKNGYTAPNVIVTGELACRVLSDSYVEEITDDESFYKLDNDHYNIVLEENGKPETLENLLPGSYLMRIDVHANRSDEYFFGSCFLNITIPGNKELSEGNAVETTLAPTVLPISAYEGVRAKLKATPKKK